MNIQKVILANCAYHELEMDKQLERINRLATDKELVIIKQIWEKRHKMAKKLQEDVGKYLNDKQV